MPDPPSSRPARGESPNSRCGIVHGLCLAAGMTGIFLAGGPETGAAGIFFCAAGLVMVAFRPVYRIDWRLYVCAAVLCGSLFLALLPQAWFDPPAWRAALEAGARVDLPESVSPVPRETWTWAAVGMAVIWTGIFLLSRRPDSRALAGLAGLFFTGCIIYGALAMTAWSTGWEYPFDSNPTFGFFPNRNHTATLLVAGCLAGFGLAADAVYAQRRLRFLGVLAGIAVLAAALLFFSISRAGLLLLAAGSSLWVAGLAGRWGWGRTMVIAAVITAIGGILFFSAPGALRDRVADSVAGGSGAEGLDMRDDRFEGTSWGTRVLGLRALVYEDAIHMWLDAPLTGAGLGAFQYIFPQFREASLMEARAVHPESDWLLLLSEAGFAAALALAALLVVVLFRLRGASTHPRWPLRWGLVCAVLAAVLHSWIDVPFHRIPLGCTLVVLAATAFAKPGRRECLAPWMDTVFRYATPLAGAAILWLGITLVRSEWGGKDPIPPFAWQKTADELEEIAAQLDFASGYFASIRAAEAHPMRPHAHYWRAMFARYFEETEPEILAASETALLLDPAWPRTAIDFAVIWLPIDAEQATVYFLRAIERGQRVDAVQSGHAASRHASLRAAGQSMRLAAEYPAVQSALLDRHLDQADVHLALAAAANPGIAAPSLLSALARDNYLPALDPVQSREFSRLLVRAGLPAEAESFLRAQMVRGEAFFNTHWEALARLLADRGDFGEAIGLARSAGLLAGTLGWMETAPPDRREPLQSLHDLQQQNNHLAVRRILTEAALAEPRDRGLGLEATAYFAERGDDAAAWQFLEPVLR